MVQDRFFGRHRCRIVVGLPGSGKTFYATGLGEGWLLIDDPDSADELPADLAGDVVITSPVFCLPRALDAVRIAVEHRWPGIRVEVVFFENDPDACAGNALSRPSKEVMGYIRLLTECYNPPSGALPVWRNEETKSDDDR